VKPGGSIFITTQNRTLASWLVLIVAAEYIFRRIPLGTHEWNKFIAPYEVQRILDDCKILFPLSILKEKFSKTILLYKDDICMILTIL